MNKATANDDLVQFSLQMHLQNYSYSFCNFCAFIHIPNWAQSAWAGLLTNEAKLEVDAGAQEMQAGCSIIA